MTTIRLYGSLAKEFGKEFSFQVSSVREAVSALSANLPGFKKNIVKGSFHIFVETMGNISDELIDFKTGNRVIKIAPVLKGAGSGSVFKIIVGIVLVVVGVVTGQAWITSIGVSLVVGGVMELLFAPSIPSAPDAGIDEPNFSFDGALNTVAQGHAVPVGYGRVIVGSAVIGTGKHTRNS